VHFIEGDRLHLYGSFNLPEYGPQLADLALKDSLAGVIVATGESLIINDLRRDPRVPGGSPLRTQSAAGAYLGHPIREADAVIGVCSALSDTPRAWSDDDVAAMAEAAHVGNLLVREQLARQQLDRQRRFLDAVLDSLHDGVTACDADGRIVLANAQMRTLWGGAPVPDDLDGDAVVEGLLDSAGGPVRRDDLPLYRALRGERLHNEEMVLQTGEQRPRSCLIHAQPIVGADGQLIGAVQAVQDVTRRRRAERFRSCELAVVSAMAAAPTVEAAGPRVLEAVVRTLGWSHAELWLVDTDAGVLRSAAGWHSPDRQSDIEVPAELPYGAGLAGRAWQAGKPLWIRDVHQPQSLISPATATSSGVHTALAIPVRNRLEPLGVLVAFADTIEDPEDELVALMSGIAAQIAQFIERRLVEELQRQLAHSRADFLGLVGHELRTPLTSISAYTDLLREADADSLFKEGPRLLEVIGRNASHLRHIIDELLELSALDSGHATMRIGQVDLAEVVRESVLHTREVIADEPVTIEADLPAALEVPGDRVRLRQVVDNLLGNAVRYSPDGGQVRVSLRVSGRDAELAVSDSGIDVPRDEREKMFTGLYRTSRARDQVTAGAGLGMTLSRAVVQRHHGTIELVEQPGTGTTVVVRLPLDAR
jgi:PAS domain S-box-containing protein